MKKNNNNNIIYIDFMFKRKKINSKLFLSLYKIYSTVRRFTLLSNNKSKNLSKNVFTIRKTSNY